MLIEELTLLTGDLAAQRDFYCRVLGLPQLAGEPNNLAILAGRSRLVFKQAAAGWAGFYHFAFNIPANQLPAAKSWLLERTELLRTPEGFDQVEFASWEAASIYFSDPAGNIVELIARRPLANGSSRPFDAQSILAIDEIGLVAEDVPATVRLLQAELGVAGYRSDPGEEFAALGDDHGLLIVVKSGRPWLPDLRGRAATAPVDVLLSLDGARHYLSGPPIQVSPAVAMKEADT